MGSQSEGGFRESCPLRSDDRRLATPRRLSEGTLAILRRTVWHWVAADEAGVVQLRRLRIVAPNLLRRRFAAAGLGAEGANSWGTCCRSRSSLESALGLIKTIAKGVRE
jgi:hypothetical protein